MFKTSNVIFLFLILISCGSYKKSQININSDISNSELPVNFYFTTTGFYKIGDGGGGTYTVKNDEKVFGKAVIKLKNGKFAHLLKQNNSITAKQIGAKGDGKFDNKTFLQDGINYLSSIGGGVFFIEEGNYKSSPVILKNIKNVTIKGTKGTRIIAINLGTLGDDKNLFSFYSNCQNICVENIEFDGDYHNQDQTTDLNKSNHLLVIGHGDVGGKELSCLNFEIRNCYFHDGGLKRIGSYDNAGDGIYLFGNNVKIHHNKFNNMGRWHIAQTGGNNLEIYNNYFNQDYSQNQAYGLFDFEFNGYLPSKSGKNIRIYNNEVHGISLISFNTDNEYVIDNIEIFGNTMHIKDENNILPIGNVILESGFSIVRCNNIKIHNNFIQNEICSGYAFRIQNVSNINIFENEILTNNHLWLEKNIKNFNFNNNRFKVVEGLGGNNPSINFFGVNSENIYFKNNVIYSGKNAFPVLFEKGGTNIHFKDNIILSEKNRDAVFYMGNSTFINGNSINEGFGKFLFISSEKNISNLIKDNFGQVKIQLPSN